MKKVALVGAFDRFNYGDVLLPIIVEEYLRKINNDYTFEYYGLIKSQLEKFGGKNTKPISELYKSDADSVIVVGGEVLVSTWHSMHLCLINNSLLRLFFRFIYKMVGKDKANQLAKFILRGRHDLPWMINSNNFMKQVKIIYNGVGGASIDRLTKRSTNYLVKSIKNSSYTSVRDNTTLANLEALGLTNIELIPDSAIVMSDLFGINKLETLINEEIKEAAASFKGGYITFQVKRSYAIGKEAVIADQLIKISKNLNLGIVLLPIGRAAMHEDFTPLKKIRQLINSEADVILPNEISIYEIMYLIACSKAFIGTSLHGCITALSYGHPCVALDKRVKKLIAFLQTFSLKEQLTAVEYHQIYESLKQSFLIPQGSMDENLVNMKKLVLKSFQNISDVINK